MSELLNDIITIFAFLSLCGMIMDYNRFLYESSDESFFKWFNNNASDKTCVFIYCTIIFFILKFILRI